MPTTPRLRDYDDYDRKACPGNSGDMRCDWPLISLVPVFPTCQLHQVPVFGRRKKPPESVGRSPRMNFLGESCEYTGLHGHYPGWITHTFSCSGSALPGHVEWCPVCRSCNSDCVTKRMGWGCGSWTVTSFFPTSPAWLVYIVKPHFFLQWQTPGCEFKIMFKGDPKVFQGQILGNLL